MYYPPPFLPKAEGAFFPVVVSIDCEPDPRVTPKAGPPPWHGTDGTIALVEQWRKSVPGACVGWYWRADADGHANWGPTSRPVPQWTRPGATPVETLGRQGHHH